MMTKPNNGNDTLKHAPKRTCIACRQVFDKKEIIRLVYTVDGTVEADIKGKKPGRGAYLCTSLKCWEDGLKGNRLDHALKTEISRDNKQKLLDWFKDYLKDTVDKS